MVRASHDVITIDYHVGERLTRKMCRMRNDNGGEELDRIDSGNVAAFLGHI